MEIENTTELLGWIACIITIIYTTLGLPAQIKKNINNQNTSGLSLFLFVVLSFTFISWVSYGLYKPDWFIVIPNGLGALFAVILVFQIFYYGRKNEFK